MFISDAIIEPEAKRDWVSEAEVQQEAALRGVFGVELTLSPAEVERCDDQELQVSAGLLRLLSKI